MIAPADWMEIRDLVDRYALAVNAADARGIASVFTNDGVWRLDPPFNLNIVGADTIGASICAELEKMDFIFLMVHSVVADVDGDEGQVRCAINEMARYKGGSPGTFLLGTYEDKIVRTNGRWLFKERWFKPVYLDQSPLTGTVFWSRTKT